MPKDATNTGDSGITLYCSFCGKSQHEVRKLITGPEKTNGIPTTAICDECTGLCDNILWEETGDRILVKVKVPASSAFDDVLFEAMSKLIDEQFPGIDFRYECRGAGPASYFDVNNNSAIFSFSKDASGEVADQQKSISTSTIQKDLTMALNQLSVLNKKYVHESEKCKSLANELSEIKNEYLDYLRESVKNDRRINKDVRAIMFVDIKGFSVLNFEERSDIVDLLRSMVPTFLRGPNVHEVNMWGDAIVANFSDPNHAVKSAIRFIRHLGVENFDARIGMAWGAVRIAFNAALGRRDIDGDAVNFAARLEPLAPIGGILLSEDFGALDIVQDGFSLKDREVELKKGVGNLSAGEKIKVYEVLVMKN